MRGDVSMKQVVVPRNIPESKVKTLKRDGALRWRCPAVVPREAP